MKYTAKIFAILLFCTAIILSACGINESESQISKAETMSDIKLSEHKIFTQQDMHICRIAAERNEILLACIEDEKNFSLYITEYSPENTAEPISELRSLEAEFLTDFPYIYDVSSAADGGFLVLAGEMPKSYTKCDGTTGTNSDFAGNYILVFLDSTGSMLSSQNYSLKDGQGSIYTAEMLPDGTICLMGMNNYVLLKNDETEGKIFTLDTEAGDIFKVAELGDERIALCYDYGTGEYSFAKIYPDVRSPEWTVLEETDFKTAGDEYVLPIGEELYLIDFENKCMKSFAVTSLCTGDSVQISPDKLLIAGKNGDLSVISLLKDTGEEKIKINAALCDCDIYNEEYLKLIRSFNQQSTEIEIEAVKYTDEKINTLLTEIANGNCPDIILGSFIDKDNDNFVDLYKYIDSDPLLKREKFVPGFLEALEYKGELHEIWDFFEMYTLAACRDDVTEDFVLEDYDNILNNFPQKEYLFPSWVDRQTMLSWCADIAIAAFVDEDSCSIDTAGMAELLKLCAALPEQRINDYDDEKVLIFNRYIQSFAVLGDMKDYYTYVTFPGTAETRGMFSLGNNSASYAIPEGAENKNQAWEFIRFCLMSDKQYTGENGFPVIKNAFEKNLGTDEKGQRWRKDFEELVYSTKYAIKTRQGNGGELSQIIREEGMKYLDGGKPLEEAINTIQSRVSMYLAERGAN